MQLIALVFALLAFLTFEASAETEQRCIELGGGCLCAESLNANDNLAALPISRWNPSNSTFKGCTLVQGAGPGKSTFPGYTVSLPDGFGGNTSWQVPGIVSMVQATTAGVPFISGANPYVFRYAMAPETSGGQGGGALQIDMGTISNETFCMRWYFRYKGIAAQGQTDDRIKGGGFDSYQPGGIVGYQHTEGGTYFDNVHCQGSTGLPNLLTDCTNHWCRSEICADHSGTSIKYRERITYLGGPAPSFSNFSSCTVGGSFTFNAGSGLSFYQQGNTVGYKYASHFMATERPHDPTFWIGPAYELESGSGATPPPPPAAPAAPVLLSPN